jgi:putative ABC transport system permease protein
MRTLWLRRRAEAGENGVAAGGRRMRRLWLQLRAGWVTLTGTGAGATVAFGLLVFVAVLASLAIPRESVALRTGALQRVIAASSPADRTVVGTVAATSMGGNPSAIAAVGASLRATLAAADVPVAGNSLLWADLTTAYVPVSGTAQAAGYGPPQLELAYRTALARYSDIVAGRLPAGGGTAGGGTGSGGTAGGGTSGRGTGGGGTSGQQTVVQVAVTTDTAARLGLRVGSRLDAGTMELVVTGIIRPTDPAAAFWTQSAAAVSPVLAQGSSAQQYWSGAVFIGAGALPLVESALGSSEIEVTWVYAAALGGLNAAAASNLDASLNSMASSGATFLSSGTPITAAVTSQIPTILAPFVAGESAAAPVLELLYVSLAVLGAVVVLLGARLVAQRRAAEFTLMRARGAALYQLGWLVLRASVIVAAVAGGAAAVLAIGLTPGDGDAVSWWLAGLTIAVTLAGPLLISVVPQRVASPVTERPRRRAGGRSRAVRRIVVETLLLAVAVGGLVVLRDQGLSSGSSGLYTSAAPVLLAIGVAVVVLRCYPPLVRELARIAGRSRGVVAFVGLARATRTPPGSVLPSFALVLVLAMVAFPDMIAASVSQAQVAASWQQTGADAIIGVGRNESFLPTLQHQVSAVPGVEATATVATATGSLSSGSSVSVMWVDPAQYAAVVDQAPGPRFPVAALSSSAATVLPAVATPAAAQAVAQAAGTAVGAGPAEVSVGSSTITIGLAGRIASVPGETTNAVVVVPQEPLGTSPTGPDLMLVAGPRLDAARLIAVVHRSQPDASVTLRSTALTALRSAPVLQAARTALAQGLATAAGFGVLILLMSLVLTAQTRELTLASLATMGLRRWQAQLLLAAEALPPVVAAAVGGVACAWLLAPLVGPSLNLAAFSGTGSAIVVTPAVLPLAAAAAGLVLAALVVLAVQTVITYHRGSGRALRIAD